MTCSQCGEIRTRPMTTRVGSAGASRGLSVMENAIGYRTVYENMKAAARGTPSRVEVVGLGAGSGLGKFPMPGSLACALTARALDIFIWRKVDE